MERAASMGRYQNQARLTLWYSWLLILNFPMQANNASLVLALEQDNVYRIELLLRITDKSYRVIVAAAPRHID